MTKKTLASRIPYQFILILAAGLCLGIWLSSMPLKGAGSSSNATASSLVALVDQTGAAFDPAKLNGRYALIYFGYSYCPDACPTALLSMATALKTLDPNAAQIQPVFVTIDPKRDTPAMLSEYLSHFAKNIIGLTGEPAAIKNAADTFEVIAIERSDKNLPNGYTVDHSNEFLLLSREGRVLTRISAGVTAEQLARELQNAIKPATETYPT